MSGTLWGDDSRGIECQERLSHRPLHPQAAALLPAFRRQGPGSLWVPPLALHFRKHKGGYGAPAALPRCHPPRPCLVTPGCPLRCHRPRLWPCLPWLSPQMSPSQAIPCLPWLSPQMSPSQATALSPLAVFPRFSNFPSLRQHVCALRIKGKGLTPPAGLSEPGSSAAPQSHIPSRLHPPGTF